MRAQNLLFCTYEQDNAPMPAPINAPLANVSAATSAMGRPCVSKVATGSDPAAHGQIDVRGEDHKGHSDRDLMVVCWNRLAMLCQVRKLSNS
ncbi:hypothetical protein D8B23_10540 [Verminephrobacter aporrectodeae subsp. tuberculatae]|uniref:hypothetical protein n=1 Tax=Verminephrobacter aporrectodeae TaxID=1110389 RepID=UPI002244C340|nr:hypothetical protein [Verminephrobacter aporrectodeae]MCW8198851.1 hypothetical protein [Verminephrobacter aporrectodeae subsp. tuberculatae]